MAFTIKQLKYFLAVVEAGKVSEASVAVNISASSITEAIKDLEYSLAVKLFNRSRYGVELTHAGYRFLAHAKRIISDVEKAKRFVNDDTSSVSGKLKLGVTITVAGYFLASVLQRFKAAYPNIQVEVVESSRLELEDKVSKGEIDLAILLVSNIKRDRGKNIMPLLRSERRLWVPVDHPFLQKDIASLEQISQLPYIQLLIDEAEVTTLSYWQRYHLQPKVVYRTSSVEAVRSLVATGAGVTILSDMVHRPWSLEGEKIETVEIQQAIPTMDTGLLWRTGTEQSAMQKHFIYFCKLHYASGHH